MCATRFRSRARRGTRGIEARECDFSIRLGLDVGDTFTDAALELGERRFTAKTLTTPGAPEDSVLAAPRSVTGEAAIEPRQVGLIIHGTTLATGHHRAQGREDGAAHDRGLP
jgi:hypothetical protein